MLTTRFTWQLCPGFAHGRPWASLGFLEREELPTDDPDVLHARMTRRYGVDPRWGWAVVGRGPAHTESWVAGQMACSAYPHVWEAPMFTERTSVGLDVHALSVRAAGLDTVTGQLVQETLTPSLDHVRDWIRRLPGPVAVAYEAGPTGFGLYRALTAAGIRCEVVAPSKLLRPAGERVKTDARDAIHLARLLHLDEYTAVRVPTVGAEAARDLVRAREQCRGDLMRARHRISKMLLRHGLIYSKGTKWTGLHLDWLRRQRLDRAPSQLALDEYYDTLVATKARRDRLDTAIQAMAADSEFTALVRRLGCLRGIADLTGFALAV